MLLSLGRKSRIHGLNSCDTKLGRKNSLQRSFGLLKTNFLVEEAENDWLKCLPDLSGES